MRLPSWLSDSRCQVLFKLIYLIVLIVAANYAAGWVVDALKFELQPHHEQIMDRMIIVAALVFCFLLAVPFVPGAEIGLTMLWMFGTKVVLLVYLCTLAGLFTSYIVGRLISLKALVKFFDDLKLQKPGRLLRRFESLKKEERLNFLVTEMSHQWLPFFIRHRYLALAIIINIPGNIVIGGGGGIALMAGASRLYSLPGFLGAIAVGVAPVPLAVLLFGSSILPF